MTNQQPETYFKYLATQTDLALKQLDTPLQIDYQLMGQRVRVRYGAQILYDTFTPPLAHRQIIEDGDPDVIIDVWDSYTTGIPFEKPYVELENRYQLPHFNTDRFSAFYRQDQYSLTMMDKQSKHIIWALDDCRRIKSHVNNAPLLRIFQMWAVEHGATMLHSAAVAQDNEAVLFVGQGGSGKSTTAMACLRDGFKFLGEDYCLVHTSPPCVESVYNIAKLAEWSTQHFPDFLEHTRYPAGTVTEKTVLSLYPGFQEQIIDTCRLTAIVIPQVAYKQDTTWQITSPALALKALAPSTVFQMIHASSQAHFQSMVKLVRSLPTYRLMLGMDIDGISPAVSQILDHARSNR